MTGAFLVNAVLAVGKYGLIAGACGYTVALGLAVTFQRRLIWMRPQEFERPRLGTVHIVPPKNQRQGPVGTFYVPPRASDMPTLVHFHGNADQIGWGPEWLARRLVSAYGFGFFAVEYPSYGLSRPGVITEANAYEAAERALWFLTSENGLKVSSDKLVLFGESIGCAVALEMAIRGFGSRVLLCCPFYSLHSLLYEIMPKVVAWTLRLLPFLIFDRIDNQAKIVRVNKPVCIIHGDCDEIVPFSQGQKLAAARPGVVMRKIAGANHNDLFAENTFEEVAEAIVDFCTSQVDTDASLRR